MVPIWLEKFVSLTEGGASLSGPVSSCEIDTHLQSWMLFFTAEIHSIVGLRMHATCAPDLAWSDAIKLAEIGLSTAVLQEGLAFASLHPHFSLFTEHHRSAVKFGITELRAKLFECSNPLVGLGGIKAGEGDLTDLVFLKYGGEILRKELIPPQLESNIKFRTHMKFPSVYQEHCIQMTDQGRARVGGVQ